MGLFSEDLVEATVAYIDGGARGNPGPAGYGVRFETAAGDLITEFHAAIGTATNNVAEYRGLLAALRHALENGHKVLHVRSDSELLVNQMRGAYRVKHPNLQPLYREACALVAKLGTVTFEHVRRERNAHADRLANEAIDRAASPDSAPPGGASGVPTIVPDRNA